MQAHEKSGKEAIKRDQLSRISGWSSTNATFRGLATAGGFTSLDGWDMVTCFFQRERQRLVLPDLRTFPISARLRKDAGAAIARISPKPRLDTLSLPADAPGER